MKKNRGIAFKLAFFILASCTIIFITIFTYNYIISRRIIVENIENRAQNLALLTVSRIESILRPIERVPQNLAYFLEEEPYDKEGLLNLLRAVVQNNPDIYGSTIAFEPYAFEKDSLYFAPYFYKGAGQLKFTYLKGESYRYFYWDWYQIPKELNRPIWSEPYYDEGGGNIIMATYSAPFYKNDGAKRKFMGVITADVSLAWLQDIVASIKIGKTGYGFLISKNGRIVTHPLKNLIMNDTIFDLAQERNDARLRAIGKEMTRGSLGFTPSKSIVTGKDCWIAYAPLASSGWSLAVVFPQGELMADVVRLSNTVFFLGLAGFLFLLVVIIYISGSITRPLRILNQTTRDIAKGNLEFELAPIKSGDEVGQLAESFKYMKSALKKYITELTEATASRERMASELRIAHEIQMGIVPKVFPAFPDRQELDIYAVLEPAKEVGGDFYDFFFIDDSHFCFIIGDVVGKGIPAALFMAMTKTMIKMTAKEAVSPDEIMARVNKEISRDNDSCMFITIFCAVLDTGTGEMYYSNAGHNPPFIMRAEEGPEFLSGAESAAIGIDVKSAFKKGKLVLGPSDAICLYTDGVTEAFNEKQEQFSEARLRQGLSANREASAETIVKELLKKIKAFSQYFPQSDDITLLVLRYLGRDNERVGRAGGVGQITLKNDILEIERLKAEVAQFGRENRLSSEAIFDLSLALEEIVSNIIFYAYEDKIEHKINISLNIGAENFCAEICDDGKPFNPCEFPRPDIEKPAEERPLGGLGIHIARNIMDDFDYRREEGRNILAIKKKIKR
jgi:sigma-B regulation protein RsbU (phosphoserine phosphatase)